MWPILVHSYQSTKISGAEADLPPIPPFLRWSLCTLEEPVTTRDASDKGTLMKTNVTLIRIDCTLNVLTLSNLFVRYHFLRIFSPVSLNVNQNMLFSYVNFYKTRHPSWNFQHRYNRMNGKIRQQINHPRFQQTR